MHAIILYVIQFFLGGSIIVGMTLLAKHAHPKYAAILYAIPVQFTLAAIFIYLGTKKGTIEQLTQHSLLYTLGFIGFIVAFYVLKKHMGFWSSLGLSHVFFLGIVLIILRLT